MNFNIVKIGDPVIHWPDTKPGHKRCTLKDFKSGVIYEGDLSNEEIELITFFNKHFPIIPAKLIEVIENYGHYKYNEGVLSESMNDESI